MNHRNFVWEHVQVLRTRRWNIPHSWTDFLVNVLGLHFHIFRRPHIWSTRTFPFLHTPFLFKLFEQMKYNVSYWCATGLKNSLKSSLLGGNTLSFGNQNNFSFLLNHYSTWSTIVMNCHWEGGCSGLWDLIQYSSISTKYCILLHMCSSGAWIFYKYINFSCARV